MVWAPASAQLPAARSPTAPQAPAPSAQPQPAQGPVRNQPLQSLDWEELSVAAADCKACGLCAGRKNTTLQGTTLARAHWMVVGDPPQEDDDRAGRAFAGDAGVLLDNMLRAVGASRASSHAEGHTGAYVTHVVKCRPPQGQVPQPADIAQCSRFLDREIDLLQPRILFAMGRFAIAALLKEHPEAAAQPLGKQRGTVYRYRGIPVVVSYAPQALMRNGADKAKAWADLCLAMDQIEGGLPTMSA